MKFSETAITGCFLIELEPRSDERGFFSRMYCADEFRCYGLDPHIAQINTALTIKTGTVRGMHFQIAPHADTKLLRCLNGAVYDVCVDLRPDSPSYCQWVSVELTAGNRHMLFLPAGTAHGYQTLTDNAEIMYTTNRKYAPESATGVRYNDPAFGVQWPLAVTEISDADRNWPDFRKRGDSMTSQGKRNDYC